jgi:hypothetical protein
MKEKKMNKKSFYCCQIRENLKVSVTFKHISITSKGRLRRETLKKITIGVHNGSQGFPHGEF